ncbi:MAG: HEAT repeat domain-containing protein, partial [Planctomycetota bacterium]
MKKLRLLPVVLLLVHCVPAPADIRPPVYDSELIENDLVVVARIEPDNLKQSDRLTDAKLILVETLKGVAPAKIFDVRIKLRVVVGGYYEGPGGMVDLRRGQKDYPETKIVLIGGGWRDLWEPKLDVSQNAIWFLRKSKDEAGYFVWCPEQAQPLKFKPYFAALLSAKREAEVRKLLKHEDAEIKLRVLKYLMEGHRPDDVERIAPLLGDADEKVQAGAARVAAQVGDIRAVPFFRKALKHKNPAVRVAACVFLCRFRDVESVRAIGAALRGMQAFQRGYVARNLWRIESRQAVPVLIELLDEDLTAPAPTDDTTYIVSASAARSLAELTGIHFPLNTAESRKLWAKYEALDDEVLLRKSILADIENLTHPEMDVRYAACRRLGRIANRQFGDSGWMHSNYDGRKERREMQDRWRQWAKENLTKNRLEWIYEGFRDAGIDLPMPMNKQGLDVLLDVLAYFRGAPGQGVWPQGPVKGRGDGSGSLRLYNAIMLLEHFTGYRVGLSAFGDDLRMTKRRRHVLENRWLEWCRANRDELKL